MRTSSPEQVQPRPDTSRLRLGVRAHDFGRLPAEALAARIAASGFSCVQLALNKALAGPELRAGDLSSELARHIGRGFARHGVGIEVLGCYINPIHPDPGQRRKLIDWFIDHLRFARDLGCGLVALETGSVNADYSPHRDNPSEAAFASFLATLEELLEAAKQHDVQVGIEGVITHVVSTPHKMRRVLDVMNADHLRVVFDPVNLLCAENVGAQSLVVSQALEWYGDRIAVVHAKDFVLEGTVLKTVPAGRGELDYVPILQWVRPRSPGLSVLIEEAGETVARASARWLQEQFEEMSL